MEDEFEEGEGGEPSAGWVLMRAYRYMQWGYFRSYCVEARGGLANGLDIGHSGGMELTVDRRKSGHHTGRCTIRAARTSTGA